MARSTMLRVRVDDEIKAQASEALAGMGPHPCLMLCESC